MVTKKVKIKNPDGLHMKPANELVKVAQKFKSQIFISKEDTKVEAKSLLSVLALAAGLNHELELIVDGVDENDALDALVNLINNNFINDDKEIKNEKK
jgi:phosphocarrier protein